MFNHTNMTHENPFKDMPKGPKIPVEGPKKATEAMKKAFTARGMSEEDAEQEVNRLIRQTTKKDTQ